MDGADLRDAVIVAGGRSERMGFDKRQLRRDGMTMMEHAVASVRAVASTIVVAGPAIDGVSLGLVRYAQEDPPGGGPAAGLIAALDVVTRDEVLVIAADLREPRLAVEALLNGELAGDGVALVDHEGWIQPLAARYRTAALRLAARRYGSAHHISMRRLVSEFVLAFVRANHEATRDVDTPQEAAEAGLEFP